MQYYIQNMLLGQVEAIITDSPILLGLMYYNEPNEKIKNAFETFLIESFKQQNNINFFIERKKKYNSSGRNQTENEAKEIDYRVKNLLDSNNIPYYTVTGDNCGLTECFNIVKGILCKN